MDFPLQNTTVSSKMYSYDWSDTKISRSKLNAVCILEDSL